jgi:hypothetical protein
LAISPDIQLDPLRPNTSDCFVYSALSMHYVECNQSIIRRRRLLSWLSSVSRKISSKFTIIVQMI